MFRQLLLLLPLAFSPIALAEWTRVAAGHNSTTYADRATLSSNGKTATMWSLIDFKKPPFDGNNLSYRSLKMRVEYDCAKRQFRTLDIASFSGNMGSGSNPYVSDEVTEWEAITDLGIQKPLWQIACTQGPQPSRPAPKPLAHLN